MPLAVSEVLLLDPTVIGDDRGFFFEAFNKRRFEEFLKRPVNFVQDNQSRSEKNVLRGLHYQILQPQAKLVRAIAGEVLDVAVDLRRSSPTFGQRVNATLSAQNKRQLWIPEGFAHGFIVLSEYAEVVYKMTDYWAPEHERCIAWDDPTLAIDWPIRGIPTLSERDRRGVSFQHAEKFE